jgi:hypothetical protein
VIRSLGIRDKIGGYRIIALILTILSLDWSTVSDL